MPGKPFDLDVIKAERIRIDAFLKENGFYFFSPEFIITENRYYDRQSSGKYVM